MHPPMQNMIMHLHPVKEVPRDATGYTEKKNGGTLKRKIGRTKEKKNRQKFEHNLPKPVRARARACVCVRACLDLIWKWSPQAKVCFCFCFLFFFLLRIYTCMQCSHMLYSSVGESRRSCSLYLCDMM